MSITLFATRREAKAIGRGLMDKSSNTLVRLVDRAGPDTMLEASFTLTFRMLYIWLLQILVFALLSL